MLKIFSQIALFLIVSASVFSCTDNAVDTPMGPTDTPITLTPSDTSVVEGGTITFAAVGGSGTFTWSVSQGQIGSITSAGVFNAVSPGETTVTCTDTQNKTAQARVTVTESIVRITPNFPTITHNSTITFVASGGTTETYYWWCDPPTLYGTISQQGIFTSRTENGTCTIYAVDGSNNVGMAHLTIRGVTITVSPSTASISIGDTQEFEALGGTENYTWTSSSPAVGTIETTGSIVTFTALSAGTTTITATDSDNYTGTATVTVNSVVSGSVTIVPSSISVGKSQTYQFSATGGTGAYSWATSDPLIGTINSTGLFTAGTTVGTATITATDSSATVGTALVTVIDSDINISPNGATIFTGTSVTFVGTGGTGTYYWSVTDSTVATISNSGTASATTTLTGASPGTVILYAVDTNGDVGQINIIVN